MLRAMLNESLVVVRATDNAEYRGTVREADFPLMVLVLDAPSDLKAGEEVACEVLMRGNLVEVEAEVVFAEGLICRLRLKAEHFASGEERAPRAVAPGTTVSVESGGESAVGSVCDVSESGLRIRILGSYGQGQVLQLRIDSDLGPITFTGTVARVIREMENDASDIGIRIDEMSKLERARYDHFVESLIHRMKKAS